MARMKISIKHISVFVVLVGLLLLTGCSKELFQEVPKDSVNVKPVVEETTLAKTEELPDTVDIKALQEGLSAELYKTASFDRDFYVVDPQDVVKYVGAERTVVIQQLEHPINTWQDFALRMQQWDIGPFYIEQSQMETQRKTHALLSEGDFNELFIKYTYSTYLSESLMINEYIERSRVNDTIRFRYETNLPRESNRRWALPVSVYAVPCSKNVIVYLRSPVDRTDYTGKLSEVRTNREAYIALNEDDMQDKVKEVLSFCAIKPNSNWSFNDHKESSERVFNDRVFWRKNFQYDLRIYNVELDESVVKYALNFTNLDNEILENDHYLEMDISAIDANQKPVFGDELRVRTNQGSNRNSFVVGQSKKHDWHLDQEFETASVHFQPFMTIYEDDKMNFEYELKPIDVVVPIKR